MNVLRELRKFKTKSAIAKIRILILLAVMLLISTYAWFYVNKETELLGVRNKVVEWDVEYSIDDEKILDEDVTIAIDEFYPGMEEFEKTVVIRNLSKTSTVLSFEITSVKLFGEEILDDLESSNSITTAGTTKNIFTNEQYPFDAWYYYDKKNLTGKYVDDATTPESVAKFTFHTTWTYERSSDTMTLGQNDERDTFFGESAYSYYESNPESRESSALEITIKLTSAREGWLDIEEQT